MGYYAEYLNANLDFNQLTGERKRLLRKISELRGSRDVLAFSADYTKNSGKIQIDYTDILAVQDQLSNLKGKEIDIILETPGGYAEVVEDIVRIVRGKYEKVGMIIPGYAKSAGTIFTMAGDEILMGPTSALGPIDAQILINGRRFSADAYLEGLKDIKEEVNKTNKLNAAYIPILREISPGEIQHCINAQAFSKRLVTQWLANYKFKYWDVHSNGNPVTQDERNKRAEEIATELCSQSRWLTHGRSIKIADLEQLKVKITDYSKTPELDEAIIRYYTLLRMTFEGTNIYKLFETADSQIYRFLGSTAPQVPAQGAPHKPSSLGAVAFGFACPKCSSTFQIQANLKKGVPLQKGLIPYPVADNILKCPQCGTDNNLLQSRLQIEAETGQKVVT